MMKSRMRCLCNFDHNRKLFARLVQVACEPLHNVLPRIGREGPEGEQMYSSTLPSTSELVEDGWSTPRPGRFTPRKDPVTIV